jgi:hypothetical protein
LSTEPTFTGLFDDEPPAAGNDSDTLAELLDDAPEPVSTDRALMERAPGEIVEAPRRAKYTPDLARQIIEHVRAGNTITQTCATFDITRQSLRAWAKKYPEFGTEFEKARLDGIDHLAESTLEAIRTEESPHRARVLFEAVKWLCSVGRPRKYSDRLMMDIQQTIDVKGAVELAEARRRAMLQRESIDVEPVEVVG